MQLDVARTRALLDGLERQAVPGAADLRTAAVAFALFDDGTDTRFVLTRRASTLRAHAGQWALPGGRVDAGEGVAAAAIRELYEEVGIRASEDQVLGHLDDFVTRSGYRMTPVVLWLDQPPGDTQVSAAEVAQVHLVSMAELDVEPRYVDSAEPTRPIIQIPLRGGLINAPTGAILYQARELLIHGRTTRVSHYDQPRFAWQ